MDKGQVEGYHALIVAIRTKCMPEIAFLRLEGRRLQKSCLDATVDPAAMKLLLVEDKFSYSEIADLYGVSERIVFKHLSKLKEGKADAANS